MRPKVSSFLTASIAILCAIASTAGAASAQVLTGSLSNFDVFNDTGHESHGFEIELHGLTSKDIAYTFGGTYIRYGDPAVLDIPGGVLVRYAGSYDPALRTFSATTPIPTAFTPTAGHECWTGGSPGYPTSGCEHFGMVIYQSPTDVLYRWLIEDSANPGNLISSGTNVNIAAPLWVVTPGAAGGAAVVNAAIAPPRAPEKTFGDAVWVKVFETESPQGVELNHLLTDDPLVNSAQVEVEWELSQTNPKKADNGSLQHGKSLGKGNQSVIRRFEFYKYTGVYSSEHEALCAGAQSGSHGSGSGCSIPQAGELGDYIGAQMAAAQLVPIAVPKAGITGVSNNASAQKSIASGDWVSIYGSGLSTTSRPWQNADFQGKNLPTTLDGVTVTIDGKPAAIWYISPGQLNVQAPATNAVGTVQVQVTNSSGTATGTVTMQQYAPAFFTFQAKYLCAVHADGVLVAPAGFFGAGTVSRPAQPGEVLVIYGQGFGPTSPAVSPGQITSGAAPLADVSRLNVRIGNVAAAVKFAGIVAAGEYQLNVVVPALPDGDQTVSADIGGVNTVSNLVIPIKN